MVVKTSLHPDQVEAIKDLNTAVKFINVTRREENL